MFAAEKNFSTLQIAPIEVKGRGMSKSLGESFGESWDFQRFARNSTSRQQNLHDEFEALIDEIKQSTGTELENPYRSGWGEFLAENANFAFDMLIGFPDAGDQNSPYRRENKLKAEQVRVNEFYKKADKLRKKHPEMPYRNFADLQQNIRKKAADLQEKINDGRIANAWGEFLGSAAGTMSDPENITTSLLFGGAGAARSTLMATLGRVAVWEGATNMLSEAAIQSEVFPYNQELGLDYTKSEAAANVGLAGLGGAVFGVGATLLGRGSKGLLKKINAAEKRGFKLRPSEKQALTVLDYKANLEEYLAKTNPFGDSLAGQQAHASAFMRERFRILHEQEDLIAAIDRVKTSPDIGLKNDVLASLKPKDMEGVIIERGEYKPVTGTGTKSGYGMVKFVWKHGEMSSDPHPIMRSDIVNFPKIMREFEPLYNSKYGDNRIWSVKRPDGVQVVYADKDFGIDGARRLVSIHTVTDENHSFYGVISPKRKTGQALRGQTPDTAAEPSYRQPQSAAETAIQEPRFQGASRNNPSVNSIINPDPEVNARQADDVLKRLNDNQSGKYSPEEIAEIEKLVDAHALEIPTGEVDGQVKSVPAREYLAALKEEKTAVEEIAACITEFNL